MKNQLFYGHHSLFRSITIKKKPGKEEMGNRAMEGLGGTERTSGERFAEGAGGKRRKQGNLLRSITRYHIAEETRKDHNAEKVMERKTC